MSVTDDRAVHVIKVCRIIHCFCSKQSKSPFTCRCLSTPLLLTLVCLPGNANIHDMGSASERKAGRGGGSVQDENIEISDPTARGREAASTGGGQIQKQRCGGEGGRATEEAADEEKQMMEGLGKRRVAVEVMKSYREGGRERRGE